MIKKEFLELIKDMPDNAVIEIFDIEEGMNCGSIENIDYDEKYNIIIIEA